MRHGEVLRERLRRVEGRAVSEQPDARASSRRSAATRSRETLEPLEALHAALLEALWEQVAHLRAEDKARKERAAVKALLRMRLLAGAAAA